MLFPVDQNINNPTSLLGNGADLTGRLVEYWGAVWTIVGKHQYGDWTVQRKESREAGVVIITSTIAPEVLPISHPHYTSLVVTN